MNNSTFSGNSTNNPSLLDFGGGIDNVGTATVNNSTFSQNSARGDGGGIFNNGTLTVTDSTFSGNSANLKGGGIDNDSSGGTATLKNTIVANSPKGGDCSGTITDGGYNLDSGDTCGFTTANNSLININTDPMLGPLAENGGPTQTHALLAGSPAIDKGKSSGLSTDQRGEQRPSIFCNIPKAPGGDGSDIGAFEVQNSQPRPCDARHPKVLSTVPTDGASGVPPSANIKANFSEDMLASSINTNTFKLFKKGSTTKVGATVSYNPSLGRALLNPNNPLESGTTYKAMVTTGARDEAGNRLDQKPGVSGLQPKVWFFTVSE